MNNFLLCTHNLTTIQNFFPPKVLYILMTDTLKNFGKKWIPRPL